MELNKLLKEKDFKFNKKFGQNFISDTNLLKKIVSLSEITKDDTVLEIGPGAGTLTKIIAENCKKVVAYEIDLKLKEVLDESLNGVDNVEVVFKDFMKETKEDIEEKLGKNYVVIANLPYYITTPIILRFLEEGFKYKSLSFMMQKEVGDRLIAKEGTKDYGSISVLVQSKAHVKEVLFVNRNMFYPIPNVDSVIVKFDPFVNKEICDEDLFNKVIRGAFKMRRKTLTNNLNSEFNLGRDKILEVLSKTNLDANIRGEDLSLNDFYSLTKALKTELGK